MTTTLSPTRERTLLRQLAAIHVRRYLRHPLYWLGLALLVWYFWLFYGDPAPAPLALTLGPAFALGVLGMIITYRLAVTEGNAVSLLPSAPTSSTTRTLALVGACVVPLVSAVVAQVLLLGMFLQTSNEPAMDAIGGPLGLGSYLLDTGIVACFGAPVLGIAVARWWRFPGAGVVATLLLFAAVLLTMGPSHMEGWGQSWWVQAPATAAPYVDWVIIAQTGEVAGPRRGSPVGHLVYAVALSGLAVWAAVIKDAEGAQRVRWTRIGWTLTGLAAASYLWALLG